MSKIRICTAVGATAAALVAATPGAAAPRPDAPLPRAPDRLAATLARTTDVLHRAVERWQAGPARGSSPIETVTLNALYQQRIYLLLARDDALARRTLPRLPPRLRAFARDTIVAKRELGRLVRPRPLSAFRVGPPAPAARLLAYYREAQRRFRVAWHVLAAVNFVESAFGRLRSASSAGAQGPMQFLPATWRAYGLGGNIHEPRDAILGAANYLRASGAPRDYERALYAYNRSRAYVDAVVRYARQLRDDRRAYFVYYSWQVFVRTPAGLRRLTGPGRR